MKDFCFMIPDQNQLRRLPSVDELLQTPTGQHLVAQFSRDLAVRAIRTSLAQARISISAGASCPPLTGLLVKAEDILEKEQQPHLHSVINATGVIINTNLGRAPISQEALQAVQTVSRDMDLIAVALQEESQDEREERLSLVARSWSLTSTCFYAQLEINDTPVYTPVLVRP